MVSNIAVENDLIEQAKQIGNHESKKAAVTEALIEYIRRRKQMKVIELFGTIDFYADYDYKAQRI
ncbi:type II toxin-antitoxin system VapB family antitoxin [Desulfobacterales bacterium HSG16]|nr:type II toxin-antitoxin system VapB family antitoxin [Desulfobacterales bacterium HSG16]